MSKYCPKRKEKVIYLECLECESKICRNNSFQKTIDSSKNNCEENKNRKSSQ